MSSTLKPCQFAVAFAAACFAAAPTAFADEPVRLVGEVGFGVFGNRALVPGQSSETALLPYVFAQYGRLFGRVDVFGVKALPFGHGHLEISTRVLQDGIDTATPALAGLRRRESSRPLGLSTFQLTPIGAVTLIAMHDFGDSGGNLVDFSWIGKLTATPWLTVFPQLGIEHARRAYVDYYYGVSAAETGWTSYRPGAATSPYLALYTDTPLSERVSLTLSLRRRWLSDAITDSPLIARATRDNAYAAVTWRFE